MCNAWNHPIGCDCGFGGEVYAVRRPLPDSTQRVFGSQYAWVPVVCLSTESFLIPNASCPVCGVSVFFYQSSNGGRVFFDELGPPWPKHRCTDSRSIPGRVSRKAVEEIKKVPAGRYKWQIDGWSPLFISSVSRIDNCYLRIKGKLKDVEKIIYASKKLTASGDPVPITNESIAYLKQNGDGKYQLSYITTRFPDHVTISAFSSLLVARQTRPVDHYKAATSRSENKRGLARYNRVRQDVECFLALVVRSEITGGEMPRLPKSLTSRLQALIASRGGVLEWAKSRPEYSTVKRQERSKLRRANRSTRKSKNKRKLMTEWGGKGKR